MPDFSDENIYRIFGNEDAENERPERLKEYFFRNKAYESMKADLPIRILVGHKGVGKSALLKVCHLEDADEGYLSLWVRPNDVFGSVNSKADSFLSLIENWKIGLSTLIVRKTLEAVDQFDKADKVTQIRGGPRQLLSVLGKEMTEVSDDASEDVKSMIRKFREKQRIRVYLDDLDRGWQARLEDISNISALLNAVRDMAGADDRIQFRIGLRTDVYHLVRTSDESTDKVEANLIWLTWTNHEILAAMAKRISTFFGEKVDELTLVALPQREIALKLNRVIAPKFEGRGKWENEDTYRILMTLVRKRPRDLVKIFYNAAKEAKKDEAQIIQSAHLQRIFERYSNERLRDVINEFKTELSDIENFLLGMRQTAKEREAGIGPVFEDGELFAKIKTISSGTNLRFTNGEVASPQNLAKFLYKCDFVTARYERDNFIVRKHFEENQILANTKAQFGFKWEIHPAYRWALEPQRLSDIIDRIQLSHVQDDV